MADRLYILAVVVGLALRDIIPVWLAVVLPLRDVLLFSLVPFLRTRGYSALPVHFLGKAATANLLYAFPLLLLGDGTGDLARLADVFGWAFAIWGTALYWWAGILYAYQVFTIMRDPARSRWPREHRHRRRGDRAVRVRRIPACSPRSCRTRSTRTTGSPPTRRSSGPPASGGSGGLMVAVVVLLFGGMIGISALRTEQQRPVAQAERDQLVDQIHERQDRLDGAARAAGRVGERDRRPSRAPRPRPGPWSGRPRRP